jgi:hypothetical protein
VRGCLFCIELQLLSMKLRLIVCVLCVSITVSLILPLFGVLCCLIIKISFPFRLTIKYRPSVGCSAVEVDYYVI